jgi:hypothetical protein
VSVGVIYVATGQKYIDEACVSAASLKDKMPDMHVTLFSDRDVRVGHFDKIVLIENPHYGMADKILSIQQSPYERTLYLDADTYICDDVSELFALLDRFDIAATHKGRRFWFPAEGVPESFPEFNGGVISFKNSPLVRDLFVDWYRRFKHHKPSADFPAVPDEAAFREAMYFSNVRIATLTSEYNCQFSHFGGFQNRTVKILHGRHPDLPAIAKAINANTGKRVFLWKERRQRVRVIPHKRSTIFRRIGDAVRRRGIWGAMAVAVRKLSGENNIS